MAQTATELNSVPTSIAQSAIPALCEAMKGLCKDPVFANMPLQKISADQLLLSVVNMGSAMERAALSRHLTPASAFAFPDVYNMAMANGKSLETAIGFLEKFINSLAVHYGCSVVGDIKTIAYTIIQDYGGLTLADLLIFFERAKGGKYVQDFQHIASRGINWQFLKTWLDSYCDEKEDARMELNSQYSHPKPDQGGVSFPDEMEKSYRLANEERARRNAIEAEAEKLRGAWERPLYQTLVTKVWYKIIESFSVDENGKRVSIKKEVICDENDTDRRRSEQYPIRVFTDGAVERLITRAIYEYVEFGDKQKTLEAFERLKRDIDDKYNGEHGDHDNYRKSEMKSMLTHISSLQRTFNADKVIRCHIEKEHNNPTARQISNTVYQASKMYESLYYDEYLVECMRIKYPPLKKREFMWKMALEALVKSGHKNPIRAILEF